MYTVYILKNAKGEIYTGQTQDLEKRLDRHNFNPQGYTKGKGPFVVIHVEDFNTRSEAMKKEKWLKSGKGREWIKSRFKNNGA